MTSPRRQLSFYLLGAAVLTLLGCSSSGSNSSKVLLPPRIDLRAYPLIGLIEFSSNSEGNLAQFCTQTFLQQVQSAQPGVRVLELGPEKRVLGSVQSKELDLAAIEAIGRKYRVDAILVGRLDVTDVKPKVRLSRMLTSMSVEADVSAALSAKLLETATSATVWTRSADGKAPVAHLKLVSHGPIRFGASDPEDAYGALVHGLVNQVSYDFRPRYGKR